ncbi:neutral/alkaline non-lysosomal ceramidase N-terminal domain-containing protein [Paenactinomyces guangxiensis]|uniref:Neutral/alkaline non-lysosomal ceramidase N-terminal domain-containing protein n=1 Tax=Paenactinomyces guangxiensis TaxID=1490290 RepID=A0A7W1WUL9_9BACL|nr:neutral/alkaline non-lysosomal ceramidase N-terminal domain-containing protein [Paenactinomyces guangxiensis]MBA4496257.1 neutral/alkaline non-lysosomal ceramidase N-terminal domain-containing protein [Paenactinomyces guangxiensis]MBH8593361.1 neutral/alkaline non-lysosomal ceramidase N-terminal domain-containing protein [Paenactinomyces guangxiensis]
MESDLQLGTAKINITPLKKIPLAGFAHRTEAFEAVSHPLHLRILLFQGRDSTGGRTCVLVVSADLIWWGNERVTSLRQQIRKKWGIEPASIILHATHNHSGPQTSKLFTPSLGRCDEEYVAFLETKLLEGIDLAFNSLEPVSVERGSGECQMGIHRRKQVDGEMVMAPNEMGPVDPQIHVIRYKTKSQKTKALLVHYTCHPTTTGDNFVSSEFPGFAMDVLERELGSQVVAAYLQGCCGDIRPALLKNGDFYRGTDKEVQALGRKLAAEVLTVLKKPMQPVSFSSLAGRSLTVDLPFLELPSLSYLEAAARDAEIIGEWAQLLLEQPERIKPAIPLEMTLISIAEELSLLAMNGEAVVDYGLFIKEQFNGHVLPVPYSNGMIGYIPTAKQVIEGGYEAKESVYYFGLPASFAPSLEKRICNGFITLVRKGKLI